MMKNAQNYIEKFLQDETFVPPIEGIVFNGQPDPGALQIFGKALGVVEPAVQEKIIQYLVKVGTQTDPLAPKGCDVLRHPEIIALLATEGLARPGLGQNAALDALRKEVKAENLSRFEDIFVKQLNDHPSNDIFLLVAKAKALKAKHVLNLLMKKQEWKDTEALRIARAALGDQLLEDQFLAQASDAKDGKTLAQALESLSRIGTPRSLKKIAGYLRTPLTIIMPGVYEKSVRLNVLEALQYNFPDQPVFYPNNIITEKDYTAAEQFCIARLGVSYPDPPPPFLTYFGYPTLRQE